MRVPSSRFIRLSGLILMTVAALVCATALFLPYLLDVNAYRAEIISALRQGLNRPVSFSTGSFAWHYGPSFQFKSFQVREPDGSAHFISAQQITVQLALLPLLEKRVEIRSLVLDDAAVTLKRAPDGTMNIDDLLKPGSGSVQVRFKHFRINRGAVQWIDQANRSDAFSASLRNISLTADNLGRGRKGHVKLSCDIPAASGAPAHIALSGGVELPRDGVPLAETVLDADLSLKQGEIGRFWPYFGSYIPFANCGGRVDFSSTFNGRIQDFTARGKLQFHGITVTWPSVFHASLSPKSLQLEYVMSLNKERIDISTVDLGMEGFRIKGSFQMHDYRGSDPRLVAKASTPATFRYEDVRNYVPYGIIDPDTSDYIENKIRTGVFKLDTGILDGRISQLTHMEIGQNCNTLYIRGPVENAVLSYGPKAPTFNSLKGVIELKGKSFNLVGMSGNFGTSPFTLDGSIVEYNTDKPSNYPMRMDITPRAPEMTWLTRFAGLTTLEYSGISSLHLIGSGHHTAYRLNGDWDLRQAAYNLPGYVNKPASMAHSLKFSTIIGAESTRVTSVQYTLAPLAISGSGLIGYGDKPYLGFDLRTNRFTMGEHVPILAMWQKYRIQGGVQAHIKGGGDPADLSAMDYHGTVELNRVNFLPDDQLKQVSGVTGTLTFKGNSLESSTVATRYGSSVITMKAAIKSLKAPEGDISISSQQLYLRDLSLGEGNTDAAVKRFKASFTLKKDAIDLHGASGQINSSNFSLNGVYQTGRKRQAAFDVTSSKLDLDDLRLFATPEKSTETQKGKGTDIKLNLSVEAGNFGKLAFNKLTAAVQEENGTIYLQNLTAGMYGGKLTARGRIAAGGIQGDRYDLTVDINRTDAEKLFAALDISREVTGSLTIGGNLTARGNTLVDIKKSALGNIRLTMTNGVLKKFNTLSKVFSILNVSQLLKFKLPDMAAGGMPYSSVKGSFSVKDGVIATQDLFISSNAINMSIVGTADLVKEDLNFTIGTQPLQTVDKIVNRIPIVGWLLTGKDNDLVTAYFEAKGKWSNPQVNAIPVKSMGKGVLNIFIRAFELPVKLFTDTGEVILGK